MNLPTVIDATLFAWALPVDGKLTLVFSEHSQDSGRHVNIIFLMAKHPK